MTLECRCGRSGLAVGGMCTRGTIITLPDHSHRQLRKRGSDYYEKLQLRNDYVGSDVRAAPIPATGPRDLSEMYACGIVDFPLVKIPRLPTKQVCSLWGAAAKLMQVFQEKCFDCDPVVSCPLHWFRQHNSLSRFSTSISFCQIDIESARM